MLENILTEQSTKATGIDLYMGDFEKRFQSNLALSKRRKSVTTYKGRSQLILPRLKQEFDIIYIDGSHASWDVLTDIILSWRLLKEGGVLILDDYGWNKTFPDLIRPALSIDAFLATHEKEYEILNKSYQVIVKKIKDPCIELNPKYGFSRNDRCTIFGDFLIDWRKRKVFRKGTLKEVKLSSGEINSFYRYMKDKKPVLSTFEVGKLKVPVHLRKVFSKFNL
jgi:SAM-dependent methyltransferase